MRNILLLAIFALTACGDNEIPTTWGDAAQSWSEGWCSYYNRCFPADLQYEYGTYDGCVLSVKNRNCTVGAFDCADYYPENREEFLTDCHNEMVALPCDAHSVPESCTIAFYGK